MDIREIEGMPDFQHDIDALTWSRIPTDQHPLASTISQLRQEVRWVGEKTIIAHNLSIQTAQMLKRSLIFIATTLGGWGLIEIAQYITHK